MSTNEEATPRAWYGSICRSSLWKTAADINNSANAVGSQMSTVHSFSAPKTGIAKRRVQPD